MYKNIIFDLGGVFITLDPKNTMDVFAEYGADSIHDLYKTESNDPLIDAFEKGHVTAPELRIGLQQTLDLWVDDKRFDYAWNAMLGDFPLDRLAMLEKLSTKYHLILLSNTNDIHFQAVFKILDRDPSTQQLLDAFDREYYSHHMGMRKPDKQIYEAVLEDAGIHASETLFVDDSLIHASGATAAGIDAIHLASPMTVLDVFNNDLELNQSVDILHP